MLSDCDVILEHESKIPSREQCQKLVEEFAAVTGTDEALAQFFLQDRDWELESSVNAYFEARNNSGINILNDGTESEVVVTFDSAFSSALSNMPGVVTTKPPDRFSILTWNLDGLDHQNLKKRTKAVAKIIETEKPDIVFLQEVIPATYSYLEDHLSGYMFLAGGTHDYFIATLILRTTVYFDGHSLHPFPNTSMGRNMLLVECHIGSLKLRLVNTHLESTAEYSGARKTQLKMCFSFLTSGTSEHASIFGGDLNLRDKELNEVGLPPQTCDLWEKCGRRPECRYTWDTLRNTNKSFPGRFKPQARFDRLYLHQSIVPLVNPVHFGLTGIQRVSGTQSFPSDHWAILCHFQILNQNARTSSPPPSCSISKCANDTAFPSTSQSVFRVGIDRNSANDDVEVRSADVTEIEDVKTNTNSLGNEELRSIDPEGDADDSIIEILQPLKRKKSDSDVVLLD